jgi:hypothetical protein
MTNDVANSKARAVLQDIGAERRVIPVLTKPDRLLELSSSEYLKMFLGQGESPYDHQARIVMMHPNMKLVYTEARKIERDFFLEAPWDSISQCHRSRLGVGNLRLYLQQILFTKTREALPQNICQISRRLDSVSKQLAALQCEPGAQEVPLIIERATTSLERYLRKVFDDSKEADEGTFLHQYTSFATHFQAILVAAHPRQVLLSLEEEGKGKKSKRDISNAGESRKDRPPQDPIILSSDEDTNLQPRSSRKTTNHTNGNKGHVAYQFRLEEVRGINNKYRLMGMGNEIYPQALQDMRRMSVSNWSRPLDHFMAQVSELLNDQLQSILHAVLGKYEAFPVYPALREWLKGYIDQAMQREWTQAEDQLAVEQAQPYTMDTRLSALAEKHLVNKSQKRAEARLSVLQAQREANGGARDRRKLTVEMLGPDEYKIELEMSARVRAYYDIAATRFGDIICQGVVARLFPICSEALAKDLKAFIGVDKPDQQQKLKEWLTEDPAVTQQRERLLEEKKKLEAGMQYISQAPDPDSTTKEQSANEDDKENQMMVDENNAFVDENSNTSTPKRRKSSTPSSRKSSRTSISSQSPKTSTTTPNKRKASDEPADSPPSTQQEAG